LAFEIYKPRGNRENKKQPVVSLSRASIVLNNVARDILNSPKRIEIAYDDNAKTLRIRPVSEGGMEMRKTKIFGKGLYNFFGINTKGKFPATFNSDENALYVNIG